MSKTETADTHKSIKKYHILPKIFHTIKDKNKIYDRLSTFYTQMLLLYLLIIMRVYECSHERILWNY